VTRRALLAVLLLCAAVRARAADGCAPAPIGCNEIVRGRLAAGDCVRADGTLHDTFEFNGAAGQFVRAVVYAQSPGVTNPILTLVPPGAEQPPVVWGGKGAATTYVLRSSGKWTMDVGSRDPSGAGDYLVELTCTDGAPFAGAAGCLYQYIHCGQTAEWKLAPDNCHFADSPNRFYVMYAFYGVAGDVLSLSVESEDFNPRLNVYRRGGGAFPIALSRNVGPTREVLTFTIPESGIYDLAVTSRFDSGFGRYKLTVDSCLSPGCLPPVIVEQPADVVVPFGATAKLTAQALALGTVRYLWYDRTGVPPVLLAEGQTFTTPRITRPQSFALSAVAPCGTADSRVVTVRPASTRERAARH
jgi:hypothetical protein